MDQKRLSIPGRSRSTSQVVPAATKEDYKRPYSYSVLSVNSDDDNKPYANRSRKLSDIDLENQLIQQAGGKREDVMCFFFKLTVLMALVIGSGVLIFYAL